MIQEQTLDLEQNNIYLIMNAPSYGHASELICVFNFHATHSSTISYFVARAPWFSF